MSASKGSGLAFWLMIALALACAVGIPQALVLLHAMPQAPTAAECDAYPEGAEPSACAPYLWRGDLPAHNAAGGYAPACGSLPGALGDDC